MKEKSYNVQLFESVTPWLQIFRKYIKIVLFNTVATSHTKHLKFS